MPILLMIYQPNDYASYCTNNRL